MSLEERRARVELAKENMKDFTRRVVDEPILTRRGHRSTNNENEPVLHPTNIAKPHEVRYIFTKESGYRLRERWRECTKTDLNKS